MQDESVQGPAGYERLKRVSLGMAFTEHELYRLHAKAAENGLELDEYANDVLRKMLAATSARRAQADQ